APSRRLVSGSARPAAVIYTNDVMAVAGTSVAHEMAVAVPNDLSIVAWDDSVLCEIIHPPLTVLSRDIMGYGARAPRAAVGRPHRPAHLRRGRLGAVRDHPPAPDRAQPRHHGLRRPCRRAAARPAGRRERRRLRGRHAPADRPGQHRPPTRLTGGRLAAMWPRPAVALVAGALLLVAPAASAQEVEGAEVVVRLEDPRIYESSGLALSHRHPAVLWTHNDSVGDPALAD